MQNEKDNAVAEATLAIANALQHAAPGDLAAMRRMRVPIAAPMFWRLAAHHRVMNRNEEKWIVIARILARLTPTGQPGERPEIHAPQRRLGRVLCDGGMAVGWHDDTPFLGEGRLARLLAARGKARLVALERAVRMLPPGTEVNVADIAWAILNPDRGNTDIAREYYRRLAHATNKDEKETQDA